MAGDSGAFSIREAAAFLGAHEQTVRRLARRGGVPAFKVGKDWRFRREALVRWSEEQQAKRAASQCSALVIDDEEPVCRALRKMLTRFGCRVRTATGGSQGLALLGEELPDVILLDLRMPDMTGPQFLAELRKTQPALPVVIVTGYPDSDLMREAAGYAPVLLLAKPVDASLLERTVRSVVGERVPSAAAIASPAAGGLSAASEGDR